MSEYWNAILRTPYRLIDAGLVLAQQQRHDFAVNRKMGLAMAALYGASGFIPSEKGYPLGLAWQDMDAYARRDPTLTTAFSIKNEYGGRTAYLRGNAKAEDRALWKERADSVPTHSTDGFIAEQCGWTITRHGAMSNGRVHWPVIVDCGGDEMFLTLPRQVGDGQDETLKWHMLRSVRFYEFDEAFRKNHAERQAANEPV